MQKLSCFLLSLTLFVFAERDPLAGRGAPYLRMGMGSRARAMGNAHVAFLAPSTAAAFWNPAMTVMQKSRYEGTAGYRFLSLGRQQGHLAVGLKVPPRAGVAVAVLYSGDGDIPIYDSDENLGHNGRFLSMATHIAVGYKLKRRLSVGLNTTLHHNYIFAGDEEFDQMNTSELGNLDLAVFYQTKKRWAFGLNLKEIKSRLNWEAPTYGTDLNTVVNDSLPLNAKLGSAFTETFKTFKYTLVYDVDLYLLPLAGEKASVFSRFKDGDKAFEHHLGAEFFLYPHFPLRMGVGSNEGFSTGFGFFFEKGKIAGCQLDYVFSIEPNGSGLNNGVSWTYGW